MIKIVNKSFLKNKNKKLKPNIYKTTTKNMKNKSLFTQNSNLNNYMKANKLISSLSPTAKKKKIS